MDVRVGPEIRLSAKNWCFQTVVLEKTLESHLNCKETKPVNPKGNQPWIFIGRTDTEAEVPILRPTDTTSQLKGKVPDAGKDRWQEEKGTTEDEMVGWHQWLNGHEFEQTLRESRGQGSLASCSPWGQKESDTTERLNNHKEEVSHTIRGHTGWVRRQMEWVEMWSLDFIAAFTRSTGEAR